MNNNLNSHVCIFAKHDNNPKEFIFAVPWQMEVHKGDILLVETIYGKAVATATSDIFESPDVDDIAKRFGAYLPLKKVIQVCGKEIQDYIHNKIAYKISSCLTVGEESVDIPF